MPEDGDEHEPSGSVLLKHDSIILRFSSSNCSALDLEARAAPFPLRSIFSRKGSGLAATGDVWRSGAEHLCSLSGLGYSDAVLVGEAED